MSGNQRSGEAPPLRCAQSGIVPGTAPLCVLGDREVPFTTQTRNHGERVAGAGGCNLARPAIGSACDRPRLCLGPSGHSVRGRCRRRADYRHGGSRSRGGRRTCCMSGPGIPPCARCRSRSWRCSRSSCRCRRVGKRQGRHGRRSCSRTGWVVRHTGMAVRWWVAERVGDGWWGLVAGSRWCAVGRNACWNVRWRRVGG